MAEYSQSAVHTVFDIAELREMIIKELPLDLDDLAHLSRVSRIFRDTIHNSRAIRRHFLRTPDVTRGGVAYKLHPNFATALWKHGWALLDAWIVSYDGSTLAFSVKWLGNECRGAVEDFTIVSPRAEKAWEDETGSCFNVRPGHVVNVARMTALTMEHALGVLEHARRLWEPGEDDIEIMRRYREPRVCRCQKKAMGIVNK